MMKDSTVLVRMRATGENNKDEEFFSSSLSLTSYIENPRQTAGDTIAYVARESRVSDIQPKLIIYTACIVIMFLERKHYGKATAAKIRNYNTVWGKSLT